jgi:hypothetical protein
MIREFQKYESNTGVAHVYFATLNVRDRQQLEEKLDEMCRELAGVLVGLKVNPWRCQADGSRSIALGN